MDQRNFHQSTEEIIKNATAEQRIIWNQLFLMCGDRMSIAQLSYQGASAGSEFVTYRARRLFFALQVSFGHTNGAGQTNQPVITLHNAADAAFFYLPLSTGFWNGTTAALNYLPTYFESHNLWFSRLVLSVYGAMSFIGYRIVY